MSKGIDINIAYLKEYPQYVPVLAEWAFITWGHYNPSANVENAKQKFIEHLNDDCLPIAYIALLDDEPIGMCSLRVNDGIRPNLAPWLGSLYVVPSYRSKGVGEEFVKIIVQKANSLSYSKVYLLSFDLTLPQWYQKLGWNLIGMDKLNGHPVSVMEIKT
jgi:GNAT superfamily N-acetyltransferase